MNSRIQLLLTSFLQVYMVAINTIFLAKGVFIGIMCTSFAISYFWVSNVKKVHVASRVDQILYATGAMLGGTFGYLTTTIILK